MIRAIKVSHAFVSRVELLSAASYQRRFIEIAKCGYNTRAKELQKQIEIDAVNGRDTVQLKEKLCIEYIRERNTEKIEELTKSCTLSDFVYHRIIDMYTRMGSTENAIRQFDEIRSIRRSFTLPRGETARLANAMYKENREWAEIIRLFTENKQQRPEGRNVNDINLFLHTVTNAGNPAELVELYDVMVANNLLVKDSNVAGYMVKVHLVNKDLPSALQVFERQFEEHKFTSNHVPLMSALVAVGDMEGLEKIFKCMQTKFTKGNSVLELVTGLLNIGNVELARVVLKHSRSHITDHDFRKHCERYSTYEKYDMLQHFLNVTGELEYDRSYLYSSLLAHFCAQNETNQALDLWHLQRDQNEEPSCDFLLGLAAYLKGNGLHVPFAIPKPDQPLVPPNVSLEGIMETKKAIEQGDVDAALQYLNEVNPNSTRFSSLSSDLIRLLLKNKLDRKTEAIDIVTRNIKLNRKIYDDVLHKLVQQLCADGDIQSLERLGDLLPIPTKCSIRFGSELVKAYQKTGNWADYFSTTLTKKRMNVNVSDRIPMEDLLTLLQNQSIPAFEKFAVAAVDVGAYQPLNILWAHYFLIDSHKSSNLYDQFEQYYPEKFDIAFLGAFLANEEDADKLEKVVAFAAAKCEKQLPAIKIIRFISRMMK